MAIPLPTLLREARARTGLSQRQLADLAQTPQSSVGRIEAGLVSPSFEMMQRLLAAAGFELHAEISPRPVEDSVVAKYKKDIDRTLLHENLKKTPEDRVRSLQALAQLAAEARGAGRTLRRGR